MSINELWTEIKLYFHHEFIDSPDFPIEKKNKLKRDLGSYFINNDFTIYQQKSHPKKSINKADLKNNFLTFMQILYHLPINKVRDFLQFHYDNFSGDKVEFLEFTYHQFKASKTKQGDKEINPPQQKVILLEWCKFKLNESDIYETNHLNSKNANKFYINKKRIKELKSIKSVDFDFTKLIKHRFSRPIKKP